MTPSPSLHRRALPLAIAAGLVSTGLLLADAVCSSQILSIAGPVVLSITYPISGIAVGIAALIQFSSIDRRPRLKVVRTVSLLYAGLFTIAVVLVLLRVLPVVTTTAVWLLSDQVGLFLPVILWSLAADVFNAAEGKKIFGWMMGLNYGAQILGLGITMVAPAALTRLGVPLPVLLFFSPIALVVIAIWIPRALRNAPVSQGKAAKESTKAAVVSAGRFIHEVHAWRYLFMSTTLAAIAALTALLSFQNTGESIIGADAGLMQTYFALAALVILFGCMLYQWKLSGPINRRMSIAAQFAILPVATIIGGLLIALAGLNSSLAVLLIGIAVINIPNYSVDENIRHEALTFIPDQLRARVTLVIDLGRRSLGLILSGVVGVLASTLGMLWLGGVAVFLLGIAALVAALALRHRWEDSMLNWRLRRRKHGSSAVLQWNSEDDREQQS